MPELGFGKLGRIRVEVRQQLVDRNRELRPFDLCFDEIHQCLPVRVAGVCEAHVADVDVANEAGARVPVRVYPRVDPDSAENRNVARCRSPDGYGGARGDRVAVELFDLRLIDDDD